MISHILRLSSLVLLSLVGGAAVICVTLSMVSSSQSQAEDQALADAGRIILACPHCCGNAEYRTFVNYDGQISYETGAVVCPQCGAQTKEQITSGYYGISVEPATIIQKWNRRCGRGTL